MSSHAPVERTPDGVRLRLSREERALLAHLAGELRALLASDPDAPTLQRLFPDAYAGDDEAEEDYRRLVHSDLVGGRLAALRVVEETLTRDRLDDEELDAWLRSVNDLRLVLGTRLGVTEEVYELELGSGDPVAPELAVFFYLTWLQERVLEALQAGPAPGGARPNEDPLAE